MPVLTSDITNKFKLALAIVGENRGFSESYFLTASTWDDAVLQGKHISQWRAALLGTDLSLAYSVVAKVGPDKVSKVVITTPIAGGLGVKFASADSWSVTSAKINSPGVGPRIRYETDDGFHAVRLVRGVPDGMVTEFKLFATTLDTPDLGTYTAAYSLVDGSLPYAGYWPFPDTTPPSWASSAKTWQDSFKQFLCVTYNYTTYGKVVAGTGGSAGSLSVKSWTRLVYREVSERRAGRPSLR